VVVIRSRAA